MPTRDNADQGFMLVGLIVAIFLILLALSVAAPRVAKELKREREVEAVHRGNQYVRGIRQFYLKNGNHYPGSLEQLEKTNNQRFLRQRYVDPLTGKPDWRLIHVGEAKTTVKGFFGKPLAGLTTSAPGSGLTPSTVGTSAGQQPTPTAGSAQSAGGSGQSPTTNSPVGSPSTPATGTGSPSIGTSPGAGNGSPGFGSQSASSFTGTGTPIMGVSSVAAGDSIVVVNEQTTYPTWEFIYDPRIEQLKAKTGLLGGAPSLGSNTPSNNGLNSPSNPNTPPATNPNAPPATGAPTPAPGPPVTPP